MSVPPPNIIVCSQWGARKPKAKPIVVARPTMGILHHTDGHHPEVSIPVNESTQEAILYARAIQNLHMDVRGWNDSGHNFLVCRNGDILQGRWGSVAAIEHGRMVESAHCPGANGEPGVEFEHLPREALTGIQENAGIYLFAWIFDRCGISPYKLFGHKDFYNTDCPDSLYPYTRSWRLQIASVINAHGRTGAQLGGEGRARRAVRKEVSKAK